MCIVEFANDTQALGLWVFPASGLERVCRLIRCCRSGSNQACVSEWRRVALSQIELKRIDKTVGEFCRKRSPAHLKDKLRLEYSIKGHDVLIYERRPRWDKLGEWMDSPVAKLKWILSAQKWRLYWQRADLKWHEYPGVSSSEDLGDLVREIDDDPLACFFG